MKIRRWLTLILFWGLVAAAVAGLVLTRSQPAEEPAAATAKPAKKGAAPPRKERLVDETPLLTARALAPLAITTEEKTLARQAERVANHEVDLAFTDLLRQAAENPPPPTPETQELLAQRDTEESAVEAGRKRLAQLTQRLASAPERERANLEDQVEVARAQLELDQDELDQLSEDLERLGADPKGRIRRLKAAHNAADQMVVPPAPAPPVFYQPGSFLAKLKACLDARDKLGRLAQARQYALDKATKLEQRRVTFAKRVQDEKEGRESAKQKAAGFVQGAKGAKGSAASTREEAKENLETLKRYMSGQRRLGDMGKRLQDQHELAEVYANWGLLAQVQQREALHSALKYVLAILLILLGVMIADRLFIRLFEHLMQGQKRVGRVLKIVKFATQTVGALTILFVIFGLPNQMTTIFGLAGAGLTVALKDFIVAFFGWFVLVGRNGIHVGDWVEIKGVGGEVVEIGLLRTLLMETGNWSDSGHPTGRIVSFVNSFAMEGHFFNFSTSGQWMWDELRVGTPPGQDPYPLIDAIRRRVEEETQANAQLAEREWHQSTHSARAQAFSALPGINVVPTGSGVEIRVRYITRAYERHETRAHLNQAVVEIMHGKHEAAEASQAERVSA